MSLINEFLLFDNDVSTKHNSDDIEDNTVYDFEYDHYDGITFNTSEDDDNYYDDEDDYYDENGDIYIDIENDDFLNEEANIESLRAWFDSEEKTESITTLKIANKLYSKKRYKEAKVEYKKAEEQLKKCKDNVKKIDSKFISTAISWAALATYIIAFMHLIMSIQSIIDKKDWWKPTTWISDFITRLKNIVNSNDFNIIKIQIISSFDFLINFCKRRQSLCDKNLKKEQYFKEDYFDDDVDVYIDEY